MATFASTGDAKPGNAAKTRQETSPAMASWFGVTHWSASNAVSFQTPLPHRLAANQLVSRLPELDADLSCVVGR